MIAFNIHPYLNVQSWWFLLFYHPLTPAVPLVSALVSALMLTNDDAEGETRDFASCRDALPIHALDSSITSYPLTAKPLHCTQGFIHIQASLAPLWWPVVLNSAPGSPTVLFGTFTFPWVGRSFNCWAPSGASPAGPCPSPPPSEGRMLSRGAGPEKPEMLPAARNLNQHYI